MDKFFDHQDIWHSPTCIAAIVAAVVIALSLYFIPVARIVHRTGYSAWWVLLVLLPGGNLIGLWLLAFVKWPSISGKTNSAD